MPLKKQTKNDSGVPVEDALDFFLLIGVNLGTAAQLPG
jgi:hypothetical protein